MPVTVIGAGPAGSSAALSALREGAEVALFDKSRFPRHKVCGEFLSPEAAGLLDGLGVWGMCKQAQPSTLRSVFLRLGKRTKSWRLSEPAYGLSRYSMDEMLRNAAVSQGAVFHREPALAQDFAVLAHGRCTKTPVSNRLFGFKAHFEGPTNDVMSLYFFRGAYIGVNVIEGGRTNVCGLAPERLLRSFAFEIDELLRENQPISERLAPLTRSMDWICTGPLIFGPGVSPPGCYPAGDANAFIDPFTGSGMLGAIATGILAGRAAAHRHDPCEYRRTSGDLLRSQHLVASVVRAAIQDGWAERLLPLVPGKILFHTTRPRKVQI